MSIKKHWCTGLLSPLTVWELFHNSVNYRKLSDYLLHRNAKKKKNCLVEMQLIIALWTLSPATTCKLISAFLMTSYISVFFKFCL